MKRRIISLLLIGMILTSCSSDNSMLLSYEENGKNTDIYHKEESDSSLSLFSNDLAIVTDEIEEEHDDKMLAAASLLVNRTTKETLYADNAYERLYPASITKLATCLMALRYGNLDDVVVISYNASHITEIGAQLCGFQEGDQVTLRTLVNALLVHSGNDAGIAIAEYIAGSVDEFSKKMNEELKSLGATGTHFTNPHGLHDDEHYTTVYDLYLIFNELLNYEEFLPIIQQTFYSCEYTSKNGTDKKIVFNNTNLYLQNKVNAPKGITILGGKTGTTNKAGSCLILLSKDSKGEDIISVILNAQGKDALYKQMNTLLEKIK